MPWALTNRRRRTQAFQNFAHEIWTSDALLVKSACVLLLNSLSEYNDNNNITVVMVVVVVVVKFC
jgi:hypothetical protein